MSTVNPCDQVYLDYQATTPVDTRVLDEMLPFLSHQPGNPHSTQHTYGQFAYDAVEHARDCIASAISVNSDELTFCSGATEGNNLVLRGVVENTQAKAPHIISTKIEHASVLATLQSLSQKGVRITLLDVDSSGRINLDDLIQAIKKTTSLVSIMMVNNETGVIQPYEDIAEICQHNDVLLHMDAAQALGKISLDCKKLPINFLTFSAHKLYGPQGIGAVFIRRHNKEAIAPLITGGSQESGVRSGTVPVPLAVGFGKATALCVESMDVESAKILELRNRFWTKLHSDIEGIVIHGSMQHRIAGNLNIGIPDLDAESLLYAIPEIAISTGSACHSGASEPSHVLKAMGVPHGLSMGSLRIGFGRMTTKEQVDYAADKIIAAWQLLK